MKVLTRNNGIRIELSKEGFVTAIRSAYPAIHFTIEDVIAEGEQVVARYMWRGTNTGDLAMPRMLRFSSLTTYHPTASLGI